ncbi:MAG: hypothetical protein IJO70_11370 [Lachnospiraceae bacterium]|nr:hypothetical protein [Lachnospiraceae bacterium]
MKMNINVIAETLLWENISNYVEQVTELTKIIENSTYIDAEVLERINECQILDTKEFIVTDVIERIGGIQVKFEMPFVLYCWANKKHVLCVTAVASGDCEIPDEEGFDYSSVDFDEMNRKQLLEFGNIVKINNITYSDVEVDRYK